MSEKKKELLAELIVLYAMVCMLATTAFLIIKGGELFYKYIIL